MNRVEQARIKEQKLRTLLMQGLAGDEAAYCTFLQEMSAHLRAFLRRRLTRLVDEVEDLVQESLLAIHNQRHTYDATQPVTAWVHAIARYKLIDLLRRRSLREDFNDALDDVDELIASSETAADEARRDLGSLLEQLPDKQRLPIMHVKIEGLTVSQTSQLTGLSESAVKIGIHRGLKMLVRLVAGSQ